jgi:DNA-binding NarL/FixJ family response regulator
MQCLLQQWQSLKVLPILVPQGLNRNELLLTYGITQREKEIIEHICLGKTNKEIAEELFINLQTVKDHTHNIFKKINVTNRVQLVQLFNAY